MRREWGRERSVCAEGVEQGGERACDGSGEGEVRVWREWGRGAHVEGVG